MRPLSSNLAKAPPLATVRREQVAFDPLLEQSTAHQSLPRGATNSPVSAHLEPPKPPEYETSQVNNITNPRLSSTSDVTDLMADQILQDSQVRPINVNEMIGTLEDLSLLAKNSAWAHVVRFSTSALSRDTQNISSQNYFSIVLIRYEALYRLKLFDELLNEINSLMSERFADSEKNFLIFQDGNIFDIYCSLRLIKYEIFVQTGHGQLGFQELQDLQQWLSNQLQKQPNSVRVDYWRWHIDLNFINFYTRGRNFKTALQWHRKFLLQINDLILSTSPSSAEYADLTAAKIMLLCRTTRLLLQIGATKASSAHFEEASALSSSCSALNSDGYLQSLLLVTQGLLFFSEDKFDKAAETFSTFLDSEWMKLYESSSQLVALPQETLNRAKALLSLFVQSKDENLYSSSINNYAICCLYLKRNGESIARLEKLIGSNPPKYMTDPVVFNLCTMYDLSYSPDASLAKKKALQKVSGRFGLNDPILHWRSFRLN